MGTDLSSPSEEAATCSRVIPLTLQQVAASPKPALDTVQAIWVGLGLPTTFFL